MPTPSCSAGARTALQISGGLAWEPHHHGLSGMVLQDLALGSILIPHLGSCTSDTIETQDAQLSLWTQWWKLVVRNTGIAVRILRVSTAAPTTHYIASAPLLLADTCARITECCRIAVCDKVVRVRIKSIVRRTRVSHDNALKAHLHGCPSGTEFAANTPTPANSTADTKRLAKTIARHDNQQAT